MPKTIVQAVILNCLPTGMIILEHQGHVPVLKDFTRCLLSLSATDVIFLVDTAKDQITMIVFLAILKQPHSETITPLLQQIAAHALMVTIREEFLS